MPVFTYTALKEGKDIINGKIHADSLKEAREQLRQLNLIPTKINEQSSLKQKTKIKTKTKIDKNIPKKEKIINKKPQKISLREKIDLTNSLYVLTKTGIPLIESLIFIGANVTSKKTQVLINELRRHILGGANLSEAVLKYPEIFDQVYAGLIKAGEESGELDTTLERLVELLNKQERLKGKVITTMIYPCFVILLAMVVTTVMLTFVFPAFKETYANSGNQLPMITQVLMDLGTFLKKYWFVIPLMFASGLYFLYFIFTWPVSRKQIDKFVLDIPVLNTFIRYLHLSNFISILKISFEAGIPIVDGILLANKTVSNFELKKGLREVATRIQGGQSLSGSLKTSALIPGIVMCMISTGEESGQLTETLEQSELYIDAQLDRIVDVLNKLFEPLLLLVIGCIVLVLALALYLPLFQNYANMV